MTQTIGHHQALIYVMVTMAAVDRQISDNELERIGYIVSHLPVFRGFDNDRIVHVAKECGEILSDDEGLATVLALVAQGLPKKLYETAYALAVEVAAVDLDVGQEELRFLQMLRDTLNLGKLIVAAIERGARARYAVV
jgi:tellurite resistance protein